MSIEALLIESLPYKVNESSGGNNLQHRTERKNTDQEFSFIIKIIPEFNLIELIVEL